MFSNFENRIKEKLQKSKDITQNVISLILFGSYIRGDYIPGLSDLDFLVIIKDFDEEIYLKVKNILMEETRDLNPKLIDLPYELLENLSDPINKGYQFKFLTFYQKDFLKNHKVIYGREIKHLIPRYKQKNLIKWRAEKMLSNAKRFASENPELLKIQAGEVAKFIAVINGENKISKQNILTSLKKLGDEKAYKIYYKYVNNINEMKSNEYYIDFIESRLKNY